MWQTAQGSSNYTLHASTLQRLLTQVEVGLYICWIDFDSTFEHLFCFLWTTSHAVQAAKVAVHIRLVWSQANRLQKPLFGLSVPACSGKAQGWATMHRFSQMHSSVVYCLILTQSKVCGGQIVENFGIDLLILSWLFITVKGNKCYNSTLSQVLTHWTHNSTASA